VPSQFPLPSSLRASSTPPLNEYIDFVDRLYSGGLELLFGNERKHKVVLPPQLEDGSRPNISYLLRYLVDNLMKDQRKDMFIMEDNVYVLGYLI
jgi:hypothetical protein